MAIRAADFDHPRQAHGHPRLDHGSVFAQSVLTVAGAVLVVAATLKMVEWFGEKREGSFESRSPFLAAAEYALGFWIASGFAAKWARMFAITTFALFFAVSVFRFISGESSCGCFGTVHSPPWATALLDAGMVVLLGISIRATASPTPFRWRAACWRISTIIAVGTIVATLVHASPTIRKSQFVNVEVVTGKRFDLLDYVDAKENLKSGNWLVLLYRPRCPACRAKLAEYESLAEALAKSPERKFRIAAIELPTVDNNNTNDADSGLITRGLVKGSIDLSIRTPVELEIDNAIVKWVRYEK